MFLNVSRHHITSKTAFFRKYAIRSLSMKSNWHDEEVVGAYQRIFEQHAGPNGPWQAINKAVVASVPDVKGNMVLDLATGPGEPATTIAKSLPNVKVIASDLTEEMISKANKRIEGIPNAETMVLDMEDMHLIPSNSMDAVSCCYGLMFCDNPNKALLEIKRVLKPGGIFATAIWKILHSMDMSNEILVRVAEDQNHPKPAFDPLSMAADGLINDLLNDAGLQLVHVERNEYPFTFGNQHDVAFKVAILPIYQRLLELQEGPKPDALAQAEKYFRELVQKGVYTTMSSDMEIITKPNQFEVIIAKKA